MRGGWPSGRGGRGGAARRGPRKPRGGTGIAAPRLRRDPGGAPATRALRVRFAARREGEVGAGRRLADQPRAGTEDQEPAVDTLAEVDAAARGGAAERTGGDLDPAGPQADGVVRGDVAGVAAAELVREVPRPRAPGGRGVGGGMGEAAVVVGQELGEVGVGGRPGDEAAQAELDDEAILQGAPEAFDAPLGLRGSSGPEADGEVSEDLAEVGRVLVALEFFRERPVRVVADEDAETIAVQGQRETVGQTDCWSTVA